ncbi:MAG TPA: outer membrane beta-barrel protein, partial [Chitinophagaceae bacterium]|nr:outer membrane beta-barrel protein [Chitinophagaceae bacterium]
YGIEEEPNNGSNDWLGFVWQLQWKASDKFSNAFRYEYYNDKTGVIVAPVSAKGFRVSGFSANLDWTIIKHILWRNEVRFLYSADKIFSKNNVSKNNNVCFLSSIALWF